ncbi:interleukin-6 receptor subunit alpha [Brachionichthys hirsutus]|uniref:interleukin-6 receptor subunit alpha n=1 Tax=Brachionichthys hirsutus TaxID=412623 RepID=UPI003604D0A4
MRIFLPFLCVLCATQAHTIFDGTCPRKDPPPGVLVLSPGSDLVMTCSGRVAVDGVLVRNSSNTKGISEAQRTSIIRTHNSYRKNEAHAVENVVSVIRSLRHRDSGRTASPTTHLVQSTNEHRLSKAEEIDGKNGDEEEDKEDRSWMTRDTNSKYHWKRTSRRPGGSDQRETRWRTGETLSLPVVKLTDSGTYKCHYRGRERFSLKVIITDPPEKPSLHCFKRSPSSKIRCEWTPQKCVAVRPDCSLFVSKSPNEAFLRFPCSYSSSASRCWCALDYNEDELRTVHRVYLCVQSVAGNATSSLMPFTPLDILKPDPPSNVSVRQVEGQETRMKVTWSRPASWKPQDNHYELNYEIKYGPLGSSLSHQQIQKVEARRSCTVPDAMPGVEYLIQLRTRDEYDGVWSDWSVPVLATSWTAPESTTTMIPVYVDTESSGEEDYVAEVGPTLSSGFTESAHILWIAGSFALLSVTFAAYIFRQKDRFMTKFRSLSVITPFSTSPRPPPSATAAPEGQALCTFGPPSNKPPRPSQVEDKEGENEDQPDIEQIDAMNFNNTSYFLIQQE